MLIGMKHEPGIFEERDADAEAAAEARALEEYRAGRYVTHEVVARWLKTWGRPGRLPFREWFAAQDG